MTEQLAIFDGPKARKEPYPDWPVWDEREIAAVTEVIRSGRWGGYPYPGPKTAEFAQKFAEMQGGKEAVLMVNGTVTMEVALRAADIGWGDEVIVPAYTFQATAAAPMAAGAIPVIVDVDPERWVIDPEKVEAAITERTRAIIPVHLGHQMADMDAIMKIAERHHLIVVEDCAHAHGAKWRGQGAGTFGHFGSFSMQSSKTLSLGEGGILLCRTPELAARAASIIDCGRPHAVDGDHAEDYSGEHGGTYAFGANYRMTEIQAALGLAALERFPAQVQQRIEMMNYMEECLSELPGTRILKQDPRHTTRSFYRYMLAIDPDVFGATHEVVCALLESEGVPCWVGYEPMHRYDLFQPGKSKLAVPNAFPDQFKLQELSLPAAEQAAQREAVWLDEAIFRAGQKGVDDAIAALQKIQSHAGEMEAVIARLKELY